MGVSLERYCYILECMSTPPRLHYTSTFLHPIRSYISHLIDDQLLRSLESLRSLLVPYSNNSDTLTRELTPLLIEKRVLKRSNVVRITYISSTVYALYLLPLSCTMERRQHRKNILRMSSLLCPILKELRKEMRHRPTTRKGEGV